MNLRNVTSNIQQRAILVTLIIAFLCLQPAVINLRASYAQYGTTASSDYPITLAYPFKLAVNQTAYLAPAELVFRFANVSEDSRCPSDVQCIWAGQVSILIDYAATFTGENLGNFSLTLSGDASNDRSTKDIEGYTIRLVTVEPYPVGTQPIHPSDYVTTLVVLNADANISQTLMASSPVALDAFDEKLERVEVGGQVKVTTAVHNGFDEDKHFLAIIEARSQDGVTQFLGWENSTVPAKSWLDAGLSWTPEQAGNYELRTFLIDNFDEPQVLSPVMTSSFEVQARNLSPLGESATQQREIAGKFTLSHNGSASELGSNEELGTGTMHGIDFDISGDFTYDKSTSRLLLATEDGVLSLQDKARFEQDVMVVYGFDHQLSLAEDHRLINYSSTLQGYAEGNITGAIIFDAPLNLAIAEMNGNEIVKLKGITQIVKIELDNIQYISDEEYSNAVITLVPSSKIHSVLVGKETASGNSVPNPSVITEESNSVTPDVRLQIGSVNASRAPASSANLDVSVVNQGSGPVTIQVDRWIIEYGREADGDYSLGRHEIEVPSGMITIQPSEPFEIMTIDLQGEDQTWLYAPDIYNVMITGFKWYEKDFGTYKKLGNWEDYMLKSRVLFSLDGGDSRTGILQAKNVMLRINGTTDDPFRAEDDFIKTMEVFLVDDGGNNNSRKISRVVTYGTTEIWPVNDRSLGESTSFTADCFNRCECRYIEEGDMVKNEGLAISGSYWPIGKNGIAQKLGSSEGVPGIYIVTIAAYTMPCTLDTGEEVESANHFVIAAFEVPSR